jgi:hypothetical protein
MKAVACMRTRDLLLITSVDPASEFLDDLRPRAEQSMEASGRQLTIVGRTLPQLIRSVWKRIHEYSFAPFLQFSLNTAKTHQNQTLPAHPYVFITKLQNVCECEKTFRKMAFSDYECLSQQTSKTRQLRITFANCFRA